MGGREPPAPLARAGSILGLARTFRRPAPMALGCGRERARVRWTDSLSGVASERERVGLAILNPEELARGSEEPTRERNTDRCRRTFRGFSYGEGRCAEHDAAAVSLGGGLDLYPDDTWLILPVVICLSQRLSHACLSTGFNKVKPRMAH